MTMRMLMSMATAVVLVGGCSSPTPCDKAATEATGKNPVITVDPTKKLGPVKRLVLGHNIEATNSKGIFSDKDTGQGKNGDGVWDPEARRPAPDVVAFSKEIGISMVRYPGGCLTHNFDWKAAIGPLKDRPLNLFGIDEYLEYCRSINAEPLMNVSEICSAADAAGLVEYLNSPATPAHPWAMKRAEYGHKEPFKVTYFEMANESDHGNHDVKPQLKRTAAEYATWYLDCAAAMRKVDPSIKVGGHAGTGTPPTDPWNKTVLTTAGKAMDFVAIHTYTVGAGDNSDKLTPFIPRIMQGCMATGEQTETLLAEYRKLIKKCTGRDIPMAITEYNAGFVQEKPIPLRFSFGGALFSADYVRILLKPETNVDFANYWQFSNGYWGFLRGPKASGDKKWKLLPGYYLYRPRGRHSGAAPAAHTAPGQPKLSYLGWNRVIPAKSEPRKESRAIHPTIKSLSEKAVRVTASGDDAFTIELDGLTGEAYPQFERFDATPSLTYELSFELRVVSANRDNGVKIGLGLCDDRGWGETHSACGIEGDLKTKEWTKFTTQMITLPDAKGLWPVIRILADKDAPTTAKIEIRNITVTERDDVVPPYSALTSSASISADGRKLYVMVFNKHHAENLTADIRVADASAKSAKIWIVTGPKLEATNLEVEEVRETVSGVPVDGVSPKGFTYTFPARSMSAIEIDRQ